MFDDIQNDSSTISMHPQSVAQMENHSHIFTT